MKEKKRILISGGTSGFGFALAHILASLGTWEIILCARDVAKGKQSVSILKQNYPDARVHFFAVDLGDFKSIQSLMPQLEPFFPLNVLINCAAIQPFDAHAKTAQGYNATFGVNHLGTFALSYMLLPHMHKEAILVTLASNTHIPGQEPLMPNPHFTTPHALAFEGKPWWMPAFYWGSQAYTTSKLCNVMFTYALQAYLEKTHPSMCALAFDPGMMPTTNLVRSHPVWMRWLWQTFAPYGEKIHSGISTPEASAQALAEYLASSCKETLRGAYLSIQPKSTASKDARDPAYQKALWDFSLLEVKRILETKKKLKHIF